jgi:hypothetical protein
MSEVVVPGTTSPYFQINSIENTTHSMHEVLTHIYDVLKDTCIRAVGIVLENFERANSYVKNYLSGINIRIPLPQEYGTMRADFTLGAVILLVAVLAGYAFSTLPKEPGNVPPQPAPPPGQPAELLPPTLISTVATQLEGPQIVPTLAPTLPDEVQAQQSGEGPFIINGVHFEDGKEVTIAIDGNEFIDIRDETGLKRLCSPQLPPQQVTIRLKAVGPYYVGEITWGSLQTTLLDNEVCLTTDQTVTILVSTYGKIVQGINLGQ